MSGLRTLILVASVATIGCDRVTKHVATTTLADAPRQSFLADTVRLEYAENTGAFLGLGADWSETVRTTVFVVGNALLLAALMIMAHRQRWSPSSMLGVALFVAGGLSNLLDRVLHGAVVDFLNVGIGPVRTGIFNVADMAIMLGVGLMVLQGNRSETMRAKPADPETS
jgi:signal peptidase II